MYLTEGQVVGAVLEDGVDEGAVNPLTAILQAVVALALAIDT